MTSNPQRFWAKLDKSGDCWLWTGGLRPDGYAMTTFNGKYIYAHRLAYTLTFGPIPEGMTVDHVYARGCRNRHCANPDHLEVVTFAENLKRRQPRTLFTHCPRQHEYTEENTYIPPNARSRVCRICQAEIDRRRRRAKARGEKPEPLGLGPLKETPILKPWGDDIHEPPTYDEATKTWKS